ncbi:MAG: ScpA family protein [Sphingobium sp.]|nr:ScpA family protein [Sphingobium sp.]
MRSPSPSTVGKDRSTCCSRSRRTQKVDLRQISILALVDQYLAFIEGAEALKLEVAADYLVMAAWLAYLKSALLLPREAEVDPSPEELALRLALRLERLNAMREAGARLMARDRIGRDVFLRASPEGLRTVRKIARGSPACIEPDPGLWPDQARARTRRMHIVRRTRR